MAHKLTTCTFCGVGCGIYLETVGNRVTGVYPSMSHPTNGGRICVRGWNVHEVASSADRLKQPLLRKNGSFHEVSWDEAIGFILNRLNEIRKQHGPDALAFFNAPRCSNEESYLLQKIARTLIGTNNVDHGSGVYCNNSINVLLDMLGQPATTNSIGALAQSEVILVDCVDLAMQLPTIGGHVTRARLNGSKLIVIDARRHRIAEQADYFLQLRPGRHTILYGAMAKVIVDHGLMDLKFIKAHVQDYDGFLEKIRDYDLLWAAEQCGVPAETISAAALAYGQARSAALLYSTGLELRGRQSIRAMLNFSLLTGHIGRKGSGVYALTEQNNLQGVCDMGMLPDRFPGYKVVTEEPERVRLEKLWKAKLPATPGISAADLWSGKTGGRVKGVWLLRYDPVTTSTFSDAASVLKKLDLVIVQHLFMTSTAQYAHVVLPVVAFGEEQVSFTSTDRRIQLANRALDPPAGPIPGWKQLVMVAQGLGADWNYRTSAEIMDEIGQAVPFYSGASYENLMRDYGRQWPCTTDKPLGTSFLFEDGIAGRPFKFKPVQRPEAMPEAPLDFPLALVFGHSLYYWHQNVLVQHSETLKRELRVLLLDYPEGFVELNDGDARKLGVRDGQRIRLVAGHGDSMAVARLAPEVRSGTIFVPFFVREVLRQITGDPRFSVGQRNQPVYVRVEKA